MGNHDILNHFPNITHAYCLPDFAIINDATVNITVYKS